MKSLIDQWTDGKSLKRLLSFVFSRSTQSKKMTESIDQHSSLNNTVSVPEAAEIARSSISEHSTRDNSSSISTLGSKLLKRIRASRAGPKTDSPLRRGHSSPSGTVLTEATSVSPAQQTSRRKCQTCSYESPAFIINSNEMTRRAPLVARYPEIFTYMGRNGVPNSALALTKGLVKDLNEIFRLEGQVHSHRRDICRVDDEYECVIMTLKELNQMLPSPDATNQSDRDAKLEELKYLSGVSSRIQEQKKELEEILEQEDGNLSEQREGIFRILRDVLQERNLLGTAERDTRQNQMYSMPTTKLVPLHKEQHILTDSEKAREHVEKRQQEAVGHMKETRYQLQEAHQKLDNWKHYYEDEYAGYTLAVKNGTMEPARSFFDLTLLQEHQEAIEQVIEAEGNYEKARERVRELEVVLSDIYQSSGFANYPDDGYRASMEEAMAGDVDREWIENWMDKNHEALEFEGDCDEWEAKSIGLDDSVSVVAEGRERKRIDRWQKRCARMITASNCPEFSEIVESDSTSELTAQEDGC
ncbi:hypothetical protein MFRU_054g00020 [Monilinia fructicola]|nr:hypothetical protein MFRU_054g00020 [Monilinia fructicola]